MDITDRHHPCPTPLSSDVAYSVSAAHRPRRRRGCMATLIQSWLCHSGGVRWPVEVAVAALGPNRSPVAAATAIRGFRDPPTQLRGGIVDPPFDGDDGDTVRTSAEVALVNRPTRRPYRWTDRHTPRSVDATAVHIRAPGEGRNDSGSADAGSLLRTGQSVAPCTTRMTDSSVERRHNWRLFMRQ